MSFAVECIGDGLKEKSQFPTPSVVDKESGQIRNPVISNGRTEAAIIEALLTESRIDSMSRCLTSENTTNCIRSSNRSRSSIEEIPLEL